MILGQSYKSLAVMLGVAVIAFVLLAKFTKVVNTTTGVDSGNKLSIL